MSSQNPETKTVNQGHLVSYHQRLEEMRRQNLARNVIVTASQMPYSEGEQQTATAEAVSAMPNPYHDHLRQSLRHIEDNLLGDLSLENCAKAAGYSLYHFHRIFRMVLGVPPGEYIRLRRLAVAADLMASSSMSLEKVAEASGFSCKEVLIRAFQREHGITPSSYRHAGNCLRLVPDMRETAFDSGASDDIALVPQTVTLPALTVVGYAVTTTLSKSRVDVPRQWNRYNSGYLRENIQHPRPDMEEYDIGLCTDKDPCEGTMTYTTGRAVARVQSCLGDLVVKEIPARRYAVFSTPQATQSTFVTMIQRTWDRIIKEWVPSSPWPVDSLFEFERYCEASKTYSEEIFIPMAIHERGGD